MFKIETGPGSNVSFKRRALNTVLAAGVLPLAILSAGCGSGNDEHGTATADACPQGYAQGRKPTYPPVAFSSFEEGLSILRHKINAPAQSLNVQAMNPKYRSAAHDIYYEDGDFEAYDVSMNTKVLEVNSDETRVDDRSEVLCAIGDKRYFTPLAEKVIADLGTAGIDVASLADDPALRSAFPPYR